MLPMLSPGSFALFRKLRRIEVGDVVLVDHPKFDWIVKQVKQVDATGVRLVGASPQSTASAVLGTVDHNRVLGKLIYATDTSSAVSA